LQFLFELIADDDKNKPTSEAGEPQSQPTNDTSKYSEFID